MRPLWSSPPWRAQALLEAAPTPERDQSLSKHEVGACQRSKTPSVSELFVCVCSDLCFLTPVRLFRLSSRTFTVRKNALLAKTWRSTSRKYFLHGGERSEKRCHGRNNIIQITKSGIIQRRSLLSLVRGSLQHEGDFHQSVVILKLRQHLQQEDNGSVHMRCKTSRAVNLIYWNTPDALKGTRRGEKEKQKS